MGDEDPIEYRYQLLKPHLSHDELRLWAAAEAAVRGPDAHATLARITGIPEAEIQRSQKQLRAEAKTSPQKPST